MSELLHSTLEQLPYVAAAAGLAAGTVLESRMQARIAEQRAPIISDYEGLLADESVSRREQTKRNLTGPLAAAGLAVGLANGLVWQHEAPERFDAPRVELVVDYSGATGVIRNNERPADTTNDIVSLFAERDNDDFAVQAFVARGGSVAVKEPEEVPTLSPFGDAPIEQALTSALDKVAIDNQAAAETEQESGSAVVVITHGNSVGGAQAIAARAGQDGLNTPIYFVNVEENINESTQASLEEIAEATGGEFWDADEMVLENISDVIQEMEPPKGELTPAHSWDERILTGLVSGGVLTVLIAHRRKMNLSFSGLSKPKETKGE